MMVRLRLPLKPSALAALASAVLCVCGCSSATREPVRRQQFLLGTICTVSVYERVAEKAFTDVFAVVDSIEKRMSTMLPESELSRVNGKAGIEPVSVSAGTFDVIRRGLEFSARSGGAFDITVGPLVALWGIGTDAARLPREGEIREALALLGAGDVVLNEASRTVFLRRSGMRLDLGAIAKGYAADQAAALLRSRGVKHALLDFGGNVVVVGSHPSRPAWRIGVQDPEKPRGSYLGILEVADTSVVTSGPYERSFVQDGVRYHHILDTGSGYPVANGVLSTTVVCASSTTADALSTSLFALGPVRGLGLARATPGVEAMVITEDRKIHVTPGLRGILTVTDSSYVLAGD